MKKKQEKYCELISLSRPPVHSNDQFESFLKIFELPLDEIHEENPFIISVLGNFAQSLIICEKMILLLKKSP